MSATDRIAELLNHVAVDDITDVAVMVLQQCREDQALEAIRQTHPASPTRVCQCGASVQSRSLLEGAES